MAKIYYSSSENKAWTDDSKLAQSLFGRGSRGTAGSVNKVGKVQLVKLYGPNGQMKGFKPNELAQLDVVNNPDAVIFPEKYGILSADAYIQRGRYIWTHHNPTREAIKLANPDLDKTPRSESFYRQVVAIARGERSAEDISPVTNIRTQEALYASVLQEQVNTYEPNVDLEVITADGLERYQAHVDVDLTTKNAKSPLAGIETYVKQLKISVKGVGNVLRIESQTLRNAVGSFFLQPTLDDIRNQPELSATQHGNLIRTNMQSKVQTAEEFLKEVVTNRIIRENSEFTLPQLEKAIEPKVRSKISQTINDLMQNYHWIDTQILNNAQNQMLVKIDFEDITYGYVIEPVSEQIKNVTKIESAIKLSEEALAHFNPMKQTFVGEDFVSEIDIEKVKEQVVSVFRSNILLSKMVNEDGKNAKDMNISVLPGTLDELRKVVYEPVEWLQENGYKQTIG